MALNLEWKIQHINNRRRRRVFPRLPNVLKNLEKVIKAKGGAGYKGEIYNWPHLTLHWFIDHKIKYKNVTNVRV